MVSEERLVLCNVLNATSMLNQYRLVNGLLEANGYTTELANMVSVNDIRSPFLEGIIVMHLFDPAFLTASAPALIQYDGKKIVYVTIEGVPKKASVLYSPLTRLEYVTVSKFVAKMLTKAGVRVKASVHHAISIDNTIKALKIAPKVRAKLEEEFPNEVLFLFVGRNDPRKGINKLVQANEILKREGVSNYRILVVSEPSIKDILTDERFVIVNPFGSMQYVQVLALMRAVDYVIQPSLSEGFGLPVLESMSVGTPVIHTWCPPFTEFSSDEFNFVYEYDGVQLVDTKLSQYFVMHEYDPLYLADSMKDAIDCYVNDHEIYEEYRIKALEHAIKWDYRIVYTDLLKLGDFEVDEVTAKDEFERKVEELNETLGGVVNVF